jgi:radical SAM superfamily enzyme YgiQ (UPF0313 family)
MKILLVNPPNCGRSIPEEQYGIDSFRQIMKGEPLALEALAGNLEEYEVKIIDLKAVSDGLLQVLSDFKPEVVGITGTTCEAKTVLSIAASVKEFLDATVVVGGIHASSDPQFFNTPIIDYIVIGLGKASFRELIDALYTGRDTKCIPGIARTEAGKSLSWISRNYSMGDLVEERPPRYDLVEEYRESYTLKTLDFRIGYVTSALGCPYHCSFCVMANITGGHYLTHKAETIVRDIGLLGDIPIIRFADANTFGNVRHASELCARIQDAGIMKHFVIDVRSDTVVRHPGLFREWKKVGLRTVVVGFEEINDGKLVKMDKKNTVATNSEAIAILHDLGITIVGDFIVSPSYSEAEFDSLSRYVEENRIDLPMFSIMTPLPGSPLFESMKDEIVLHDLDYYTLTNAVLPTRLEEKVFYEHYAHLVNMHMGKAKL